MWLREETDRAVQKANTLEAAANDANERADKMDEKQRIFQKKLNEKVRKNRVKSLCKYVKIEMRFVVLYWD